MGHDDAGVRINSREAIPLSAQIREQILATSVGAPRAFRFVLSQEANLASAMSNLFENFHFELSVAGDPDHELPPGYFSIIPFRTSKSRSLHEETSRKAIDVWKERYPDIRSIGRTGALTERGHAISWMFPQISQDVAEDWVIIYDALLIWDGT
jgi:hypothetical protein